MNFRTQASLNMFIVHISFDNPFPYWPVKIAVHIYVLHHAAIMFCYWNWLSLGSKKYVSVYHTLQNESLVESTVKRALGGWLMYIEEDWKSFCKLLVEQIWKLRLSGNCSLPLSNFHWIISLYHFAPNSIWLQLVGLRTILTADIWLKKISTIEFHFLPTSSFHFYSIFISLSLTFPFHFLSFAPIWID